MFLAITQVATEQTATLTASHGQGSVQVGELILAFVLSAVIGLERQMRGKNAGLRTQTIVGTASALFLLVSKYGFTDVLATGFVVLDPSRVAAQIVSGIGFLGAGLILTRQGAVRGLTTAAAVWETAAVGMAAGAGLPVLALAVTALHFVVVIGFTALIPRLPGATRGMVRLRITYLDRQGVLRALLSECNSRRWSVTGMVVHDGQGGMADLLGDTDGETDGHVSISLNLVGDQVRDAATSLAGVQGVSQIDQVDDDTE
jgi:putative Mg2+ transporter-C (MgtC) family protein